MNWSAAENLVKTMGEPQFAAAFYEFWQRQFLLDQCAVWQLEPGKPPITLIAERPGEPKLIKHLCRLYSEQMYGRDPSSKQHNGAEAVGHVTISTMAADDYRRVFFEQVDLQEKAFAVFHQAGIELYLNFYRRRGSISFNADDLLSIKNTLGFAAQCLLQHSRLLAVGAQSADRFGREMLPSFEQLFLQHPAKLSAREALCCAYIVTGHSNDAIALIMEVSLNTARTFRRRAYTKLGVTSQNELFALCLNPA